MQQYSSADRLRLAQLLAGAWFNHCLTQPVAGGARFYLLQERPSFTARIVKQWGLGYAPDAYFSSNAVQMSLTEHMRSLGFTPLELVEAGLAVPTKRARQAAEQKNTTTLKDVLGFENIMDRFRGRLMIPILDATGQHILGFGGRSLSAEDDSPKYLNSPESIIFTKGDLLFGQHWIASKNITSTNTESKASEKPLLVVEGYMDAISLWAIGLGPAVATMGTAISKRQLESALQLVHEQQRQLVFCLDNDAAGVRAMERICQNGFLTALQKQYPSAFVKIATTPKGIKDPGEFVDERLLAKMMPEKIAAEFETDVVSPAVDWRLWYTQRVILSCNCTTRADLRLTIDRVAAFWSISMSPEQRQGHAPQLAKQLALLVSSNHTSDDNMISMLCEQIELNLVDQSSRMERANQATDVVASSLTLTQRMALHQNEESDSWAAWNASQSSTGNFVSAVKERRRTTIRARDAPKQKTLTPHFAGFRFTNPADRDWLGFSRKDPYNNYKLTLRRPPSRSYWRRGTDYLTNPEVLQQQSVYFNSNRYHGNQFVTEEAAAAGYARPTVNDRKDIQAMATYGIGAVLQVDKARVAVSVENTLLQTLVRSPAARCTLQQFIEARHVTQSAHDDVHSQSNSIYWSSPERLWLFDMLVKNTDIPADETREFLLRAKEVPDLAFVSDTTSDEGGLVPATSQENRGILQPFFQNEFKGPNNDALEQLIAQESFTNLLLLTAERRLQEAADDPPELLRQAELVKSLRESARRLSERLFRESIKSQEDSPEEKYNALMAQINEHLSTMSTDDISPETQEELDRIDRDWAVWTESWKRGEIPEPATKPALVGRFALEEENNASRETLEEALARIDNDWKYWIEKDT
jgi:DNA primase catalytic core